MKSKSLPPLEGVRELISYCPETGKLTWKKSRGKAKAGSEVGWASSSNTYRNVQLFGKTYLAHRICWYLHYGKDPGDMQVDHINRNRSDNRISNLRLVTNGQNQWNQGAAGICKSGDKYRAMIGVAGKTIHLGLFDCPLLAHLAYQDAKLQYHTI